MRVWFNHWFSTAYHLISLMKEKFPDFVFVGTSSNELMAYKLICDEWYLEPSGLSEAEYAAFCMDFCKAHDIDVFVPRRNMPVIAENAEKFEALGVKLFADRDAKIIRMLDDKAATYDFFAEKGYDCILPMKTARSVEEFRAAYEELRTECARVCYKLSVDEGARSFRVIDPRVDELSALYETPGAKISLDNALRIMEKYDFSIPMLLMPYLGEAEISTDCLSAASCNIILPRVKKGRYSRIEFDEEIISVCERMLRDLHSEMPMNIQFRKEKGKLYLLEINPRMSGGLQLSCAAAGVNIPAAALGKLVGVDVSCEYSRGELPVTAHLETPVVFRDN